jgi:nucleoside-diphosphate-sugar epimerase
LHSTNLIFDLGERLGGKNMANPILITGAAGRVGAVGRTVTELLLKQGKAVRAMVRNEDGRAQALRDFLTKRGGARVEI